MPDLNYEVCKRCPHLKIDILKDELNPMPLICEMKPVKSHYDNKRQIIGFMDMPVIDAHHPHASNLVKVYWKEIKLTLKKDDFIMKFRVPEECPYTLEHLM